MAELIERVLAGSVEARALLEAAGERLGLALASLINLMNPDSVILGGALCRVGELLMAPLRRALHERVPPTSRAEAQIVMSVLGEHATALGAATLVLEHVMRDQSTLTRHHATIEGA